MVLNVIRCGETTWNAEGRLHGRSDLPLSISGRTSVSADAASIEGGRTSTVYHPPDDAAAETAQIVARRVGAKTKSVDELADPDLGVLEGMSEQAFAERFPKRYKQWQEDPLSLSPPEGEDVAEARARVLKAAARLLRRARNQEVGVVLHPLGLGFLRCWLAELVSSGFCRGVCPCLWGKSFPKHGCNRWTSVYITRYADRRGCRSGDSRGEYD